MKSKFFFLLISSLIAMSGCGKMDIDINPWSTIGKQLIKKDI